MIREFKLFVKQHKLFTENDRMLLAISGGVDSMVLAYLMQQSGVYFEIAHCNFQLRGKNSDQDAAFVVAWCKKNQVEFHVRKFEMESAVIGKSVQQEARRARYQWFNELLKERDLTKLATAHHASDNVETLFINLLRGAGIKGWAGIPLHSVNTIRPLLFATKQAIESFAELKNIAFRSDASNQSEDYLRNKIRHRLIPQMESINPDFESRIAANQLHLQRMSALLEILLGQQNPNVVSRSDDQTIIRFDEIKPKAFAVDILFVWLQPFGFSAQQCVEVLEFQRTGSVFYSVSHRLLINRDKIIIQPINRQQDEDLAVEVFRHQELIEAPIYLRISEFPAGKIPLTRQSEEAMLDINTLEFPLVLRRWHHGDRFQPLGMQQNKLVSDFLIDEKVSQYDKENQWLLLSGNRIAWVVGRRIADWAKITTTTDTVLKIKLK